MGGELRARKKSLKRKHRRSEMEHESLNSLPWSSSLPMDPDDPAFSLFVGSNELDGGLLSLEEIDEAEYHLGTTKSCEKKPLSTTNTRGSNGSTEPESGQNPEEVAVEKGKSKKKKKKDKKKDKKNVSTETIQEVNDSSCAVATEINGDDADELLDDPEYEAWNKLRLHPLIMKSICKLGFKEPTPIQEKCIPKAAHEGKDVIGAAETGSGKTLAFGLPIMQRLLDEREKVERMRSEKGEEAETYAPTGVLRALIITPTRELALQVTNHLQAVAKDSNIRVVPIVGGVAAQKQERLLKARPEVVVATPGRLWELMSGGETYLVELHSLSFFVLDEADRMIENGHFRELHSIIDMLPVRSVSAEGDSGDAQNCVTVSNVQRKKRQTLVFSATLALSADFRKKLKRGVVKSKQTSNDGISSIETLSERAGMRADTAIIDLTSASILANKLEESFIECREEDKDAYLYYILSLHGQCRTIVFCTSVAALRHISSILRILGMHVSTLHAQMQQRARAKAADRFRDDENAVLIATDVAARGLDFPGVRTVIHYQLPHSAEIYVHRSGRTARASADGCSVALISPKETSKFATLCRSFSRESFKRFPLESSYLPEIMKRLSLARQIDKISRKGSQEKAEKSWLQRNAETLELDIEENDSEDERALVSSKNKASANHLKKLQEDLSSLLAQPLQPKTFSHRYWAGAGVSPLLQHQFEQLAREKIDNSSKVSVGNKKRKLVVIGQDCVEPLQALRASGQEVHMDMKEVAEKRKLMETLRKKRKEEKKRLRDQRRKQRRITSGGD
ncbi:hypothetical protein SAY87_006992 [Trapa incisa]|uniref:DEAD-box ATP-dependent RNA helicase 13 n=1 Tax=Trapa incisa TaxID=236973 RepID=A0AAN7K3C5_9MYRT|nr:hypothetical protein SAY87_006992 [Trapa incisa]